MAKNEITENFKKQIGFLRGEKVYLYHSHNKYLFRQNVVFSKLIVTCTEEHFGETYFLTGDHVHEDLASHLIKKSTYLGTVGFIIKEKLNEN